MGALDGKVAIVTGGTSGIGEEIATAFVLEGAKVVIAGRREPEGRAIEERIGARFVRADVGNEPDVRATVDRTLEWFGRIDCLVNNAGIPSPMIGLTEVDVAAIDQVLAVNVRGVILGAKHAARAMLPRGSGSIINIGSVAGHRGGLSAHVYSAAKERSARLPVPPRRNSAKRESASTAFRRARSSPASSARMRVSRARRRTRSLASSRKCSQAFSRSRGPACRAISRVRRCFSPATPSRTTPPATRPCPLRRRAKKPCGG